eukprot:7485504-Heterocapsa_arctica.AAC.1
MFSRSGSGQSIAMLFRADALCCMSPKMSEPGTASWESSSITCNYVPSLESQASPSPWLGCSWDRLRHFRDPVP